MEKMAKIADLAHFDPLWNLNANFAGHPVCGKILSIWSSLTCISMMWGYLRSTGPSQDFINSPRLVPPPPPPTIHFLAKENLSFLLIFLSNKMFVTFLFKYCLIVYFQKRVGTCKKIGNTDQLLTDGQNAGFWFGDFYMVRDYWVWFVRKLSVDQCYVL